jgi:hypothetical protein
MAGVMLSDKWGCANQVFKRYREIIILADPTALMSASFPELGINECDELEPHEPANPE